MSGQKLLLHVCCGPCSLMPITHLLEEGYQVLAWFMNPNIHPLSEYLRRRESAAKAAAHFGIPIVFADDTWNVTDWLRSVQGRDTEPERCHYCCTSRLEAAFVEAQKRGCSAVTTTLLYSIYQPHDVLAKAGRRLAEETGCTFVYRDFRLDWQAGIDLSRSLGLYRQPYCGCIYSEAQRYQKKLARLMAEEERRALVDRPA